MSDSTSSAVIYGFKVDVQAEAGDKPAIARINGTQVHSAVDTDTLKNANGQGSELGLVMFAGGEGLQWSESASQVVFLGRDMGGVSSNDAVDWTAIKVRGDKVVERFAKEHDLTPCYYLVQCAG